MGLFRKTTIERIKFEIYDGEDLIEDLGEIDREDAEIALSEAIQSAKDEGDSFDKLRLEESREEFEDYEIPDEPYECRLDK